MRPFDEILLLEKLGDALPAGTIGTIVDTYSHTDEVFIVECFDRAGNTLAVVDVRRDQMTVTLADFAAGERIALLQEFRAYKLQRGQVGVIGERVGIGLYTVDFGAEMGRLTLHATQMMLLHEQPAQEGA